MVREVWRDFLRGAAMLPMTEISMKRAAWGRSYISMLRKHILPPSAVGDLNQVKQYVRSITHQHRASSKSLVIEDNPKPIPIIINHTTPTGYFERPGTPISLNQPARSPSISTSVFSESFWPLSSGHEIDDDASVRGLMSPRSVKSDGGGGGTPGVSEHYDAYTRAIERGLQDTTQFRGRHLIVFVHGLLGSAWDFRLYKNKILLARHNLGLPCNDIVFLNSNSNEEDTFDDISTLADNLVSEIVEFVEMEMIRVDRLSFVCHSLGGIIARCAIEKPLMATFYDKYNTFTTFATPHLSIGVTNNRLLAMLASMYQYIDKSPCVDQLLLRDAQDKRDSFLYKQAMRTTALGHFKRVRLLAAAQDGYAGLGSALILDSGHGRLRPGSGEQSWWKCQPFPCIPNGSPQQRPDPTSPMSPMSPLPVATVDMAYDEMLSALSNTLSHMRVERYVVWFPTLVRKTDVLGRQAHIAILDDPMMLEMAGLLGKFHL
ncbi:putative serine esterase-domain-containing protein [Powellomyces hirtus]|nr:putative serine esterase-domain-containing protein [Powellomyces hirtus]